jgi:multiple sugar transport system ATP-binding protein
MGRIEIENVTKEFAGSRQGPVAAVRDLTLAIENGQFLVIVGPSGCGKTTTLRLIAGLEEVDRGKILFDGKSVEGVPAKDRDVAMVFQNQSLFPHLTVSENLALGLKLRKTPAAEVEQRVRSAADLLGLSGLLDRRPSALSGGECQRVALGRAMARNAQAFLLDEPLSNLDAPMRLQLRGEIARLRRRLGVTMIMVTHDQSEAMAMADAVAVMNRGQLEQVATPQELYRRPANRFVAGFIGSPPMNFFDGTLREQNGRLAFFEKAEKGPGFSLPLEQQENERLRSRVDKPVVLGLRPESFSHFPKPARDGGGMEPQAVTGTLERTEPAGAENLEYYTTVNHAFVVRAPADNSEACPIGKGRPLFVDAVKALFFDVTTGKAI